MRFSMHRCIADLQSVVAAEDFIESIRAVDDPSASNAGAGGFVEDDVATEDFVEAGAGPAVGPIYLPGPVVALDLSRSAKAKREDK